MSEHQQHTDELNPLDYIVTHSEEDGRKIRKTLWKVFWILLAVTSVEVVLGLYYQAWGISFTMVKVTFIVLTLIKAFFIVAEFMHLKHENPYLKKLIIVPYVFLALYLMILVLIEGGYSERMMNFMF